MKQKNKIWICFVVILFILLFFFYNQKEMFLDLGNIYPLAQPNNPYRGTLNQWKEVTPNYAVQEVYNPTVVGCGARREACYGGSQEVIPNWNPPHVISEESISPRSVQFPEWKYQPVQVGVLFKITGSQNEELPLFMKQVGPITYQYFTMYNQIKMLILNTEKLGMNDEVVINGLPGTYRISQYQDNTGLYIPTFPISSVAN